MALEVRILQVFSLGSNRVPVVLSVEHRWSSSSSLARPANPVPPACSSRQKESISSLFSDVFGEPARAHLHLAGDRDTNDKPIKTVEEPRSVWMTKAPAASPGHANTRLSDRGARDS